ncbi:hypothetical protein RvY_18181 [Ramazzottius varieornatus]|uniref:S-adenosylmethionine decarboxylase proenzyme n=1 Tax=Ramazzottius varieornatus TaxID=947166 RepID=A0A1D1WAS4_RAMVA|nr:hypothetical protein RvY_18181 [Ramazzottius varieornatus]
MGYPSFYEGAEKLLEMSFGLGNKKEEDGAKPNDLRAIPREELEGLLAGIGAEIVSDMATKETHAYVLSESSMFIRQQAIIFKTCGTTQLIKAIPLLLKLVQRYTSLGQIQELYYSRKEFLRPELQEAPYQSFAGEVKELEVDFEGQAHYFGQGDRRWYVYVFEGGASQAKKKKGKRQAQDCLELMMEELEPQVMAIFSKAHCNCALQARQKSGIDGIVAGLAIDDLLFEPCGYSMNGLMDDGRYATIHITPQEAYSYVSFESDAVHLPHSQLIRRVLDVFRPRKFICTIYTDRSRPAASTGDMREEATGSLEGFRLMDAQTLTLRHHRLTYMAFVRDMT